ncbi:hypothetical protein D3C75_725890 [compost metagenome]
MPDRHNQEDNNRSPDTRQCNIAHLLEPAGPIHSCGFIELRTDTGDRSQIDDRVPARFLPDIRGGDYAPEQIAFGHELYGFADQVQAHQQIVHRTVVGREHLGNNPGRNHPGHEVGQIRDGLDKTFQKHQPQLIQQDGKYDGNNESGQQAHDAHRECIAQRIEELLILEQLPEVLQADPFLLEKGFARLVFLKGHGPSPQRQIVEYKCPEHKRESHHVEVFLLQESWPKA